MIVQQRHQWPHSSLDRPADPTAGAHFERDQDLWSHPGGCVQLQAPAGAYVVQDGGFRSNSLFDRPADPTAKAPLTHDQDLWSHPGGCVQLQAPAEASVVQDGGVRSNSLFDRPADPTAKARVEHDQDLWSHPYWFDEPHATLQIHSTSNPGGCIGN